MAMESKAKKKAEKLEVRRAKKKSKRYKRKGKMSIPSSASSDSIDEVQRRSRHRKERKRKRERSPSIDSSDGDSSKRRRFAKDERKRRKRKDKKVSRGRSRRSSRRYRESSVSCSCSSCNSCYSTESCSTCSSWSSMDKRVKKGSKAKKGIENQRYSKDNEHKRSKMDNIKIKRDAHDLVSEKNKRTVDQCIESSRGNNQLSSINKEKAKFESDTRTRHDSSAHVDCEGRNELGSIQDHDEAFLGSGPGDLRNDSKSEPHDPNLNSETLELLLRQKALENLIKFRRSKVGTATVPQKAEEPRVRNVETHNGKHSEMESTPPARAELLHTAPEETNEHSFQEKESKSRDGESEGFSREKCPDYRLDHQHPSSEPSLVVEKASHSPVIEIAADHAKTHYTSVQCKRFDVAKGIKGDGRAISAGVYPQTDNSGSEFLESKLTVHESNKKLTGNNGDTSDKSDSQKSHVCQSEVTQVGPHANPSQILLNQAEPKKDEEHIGETSGVEESENTALLHNTSLNKAETGAFQHKKMSVMRGGEMVQVNRYIYYAI
eukprot:TRINITY_DN3710_c0_g1_i2.p1 TRINITY_DN3710_c0_g1~~TRINITY_DN3710_c0_g1_i2.p1  ORF type:complete len:548 (-),score=103.15 TRINITY_DN3710_c0_g1_i2:176-1819(-)